MMGNPFEGPRSVSRRTAIEDSESGEGEIKEREIQKLIASIKHGDLESLEEIAGVFRKAAAEDIEVRAYLERTGAELLSMGNQEDFFRLYHLSGLEPDWNKSSIRSAVNNYYEGISWDWGRMMETRSLSQRSGIEFKMEWTPEKIRGFLKQGLTRSYYDEEDGEEISGVDFLRYLIRECDFPIEDCAEYQSELDEAYIDCFEHCALDLLPLLNTTQVLPTKDEKLRMAYNGFIERRISYGLVEAWEISNALDLKPDISVLKRVFPPEQITEMVRLRDFEGMRILVDWNIEIDIEKVAEDLLENASDFDVLLSFKEAFPEFKLSDCGSFRTILNREIEEAKSLGNEAAIERLEILGRTAVVEKMMLDEQNPLYSIIENAINARFHHQRQESEQEDEFLRKTWDVQQELFRYAEEAGIKMKLDDEALDVLLDSFRSSIGNSPYQFEDLAKYLKLVELDERHRQIFRSMIDERAKEIVMRGGTDWLDIILSSSLPYGLEDIKRLFWSYTSDENLFPILEWLKGKGLGKEWHPGEISQIEYLFREMANTQRFADYVKLHELTGIHYDWDKRMRIGPRPRDRFERIWLNAVKGGIPALPNGRYEERYREWERPLPVEDPRRDIGEFMALSGIEIDVEKYRSDIEHQVMRCLQYNDVAQAVKALELSGLNIDWTESKFAEIFDQAALSLVLTGKTTWVDSSREVSDEEFLMLEKISGRKFDGEAHRAEIESFLAKLISSCSLDRAISAMKRSGLNFDLTDPLFMKAYDEASAAVLLSVDKENRIKLEDLFALKINPEKHRQQIEDAVAKAVFEDGNMSRAKALHETTGIKPDFSKEPFRPSVLEAYRADIRKVLLSSIPVTPLDALLKKVDFFEVNPKEDLHDELEKAVSHFVMDGRFGLFDQINERLGLGRSIGEDALRPMLEIYYRRCLDQCDVQSLVKAEKMSGVEPDFKSPELARSLPKFFCGLLRKGDVASFHEWARRSGEDVRNADFWFASMVNMVGDDSKWVKQVSSAANKEFAGKDEKALRALFSAAQELVNFASAFPDLVFALHEVFQAKPDEATAKRLVINTCDDEDRFRKSLSLVNKFGLKLEFGPDDLWGLPGPRQAALMYGRFAPKEKSEKERLLQALGERKYWYNALPDLLEIRGPSMNPGYCPWKNMIGPLAERVSMKNEDELESFVEYCRDFGLAKLPELCLIVMDLKKIGKKSAKGEECSLSRDSFALLQEWDAVRGGIFGIAQSDSDWTPQKAERIIQALKESVENVSRSILEDKVPEHLLGSSLEMHLLNALIPVWGKYGSYEGRKELILNWREVSEKEETNNPPEFMGCGKPGRMRRMVSLKERDESMFVDSGKEVALSLLADRRKEIILDNALIEFLAPLQRALKYNRESTAQQPGIFFATILEGAKSKVEKSKEALDKARENGAPAGKIKAMEVGFAKQEDLYARIAAISSWNGIRLVLETAVMPLSDGSIAAALKKAEENEASQKRRLANLLKDRNSRELKEEERKHFDTIEKQVKKELGKAQDAINKARREILEAEKVSQLLTALSSAGAFDGEKGGLRSSGLDYLRAQAMLEAMFLTLGDAAMSLGREEVGRLVMGLAALESGGHAAAVQDAAESVDENAFNAWSEWYSQELLTHFTDPDESHEIRNVPFTETAMKNIRQFLGIGNKRQEYVMAMQDKREGRHSDHPVVRTAALLANNDALKEKVLGDSKEVAGDKEVFFHTCHGLGRIFSGDIANACYDKHRVALAKGEYPDLDAVIMAEQSQDKKETTILGSYLLIRAKDERGRRCLVIRALNPKEQFVQREVTPESVVSAAIEDTVALAKNGGLDRVLLCVDDHSGGHGTNRQTVFEAMRKMAQAERWKLSEELERKPETMFNSYQIYKAYDKKVYCVWEAENKNSIQEQEESGQEVELEK